jgi:hypothetical protein
LPVDSGPDLEVYGEALRGFAERAGHPVVPLDRGPADPADWGRGSVPEGLSSKVSAKDWAALSEEARYALVKLSDPRRGPEKLQLALAELGLS